MENSPAFTVLEIIIHHIPIKGLDIQRIKKLSNTTGHGIICHWEVYRMKTGLCHIAANGPHPARCTACAPCH